MSEKDRKVGLKSFLMAEKDAEIWTLSFFMLEKVRKFELCNFLCRKIGLYYFYWQKKFGKLDFIIFIGGKSSESCTLSFLMAEKDAESWTLSFLMEEKFGK